MNFSQKFKKIWWAILLIALSIFLVLRFPAMIAGMSVPADVVVFLVWIALAVAPIFAEVDLFGVKLKQQIGEIKEEIAALRIAISQNQHQTVNVQVAQPAEVAQKQLLEAQDVSEPDADTSAPAPTDALARILPMYQKSLGQPGLLGRSFMLAGLISTFEDHVLDVIRSKESPIPFDQLYERIKFTTDQSSYLFDAIAVSGDVAHLIEISFAKGPDTLKTAASKVNSMLYAYIYHRIQQYASTPLPIAASGRGPSGWIRNIWPDGVPVLIVPADIQVVDIPDPSFPVLRFDEVTKEFVNADEFQPAVKRWLLAHKLRNN